MRIFESDNYIKLSVDLQDHPRVKPTEDDNPPSHNIFDDESDSIEDIKKKWKKKQKSKSGIVYQTGMPVPIA